MKGQENIFKLVMFLWIPLYLLLLYTTQLIGSATSPGVVMKDMPVLDAEGNPVLDKDGKPTMSKQPVNDNTLYCISNFTSGQSSIMMMTIAIFILLEIVVLGIAVVNVNPKAQMSRITRTIQGGGIAIGFLIFVIYMILNIISLGFLVYKVNSIENGCMRFDTKEDYDRYKFATGFSWIGFLISTMFIIYYLPACEICVPDALTRLGRLTPLQQQEAADYIDNLKQSPTRI